MVICTAVEYLASFVMGKAFGSVSWDYRDKPPNLQGRICLQYSLGWGMLALLVVYLIQPFLNRFVQPAGHRFGEIVLTALLIVTLQSSVVTLAAWARIRQRVITRQNSAAGEALDRPDTTGRRLIDRLAPDPVMMNSFPPDELDGGAQVAHPRATAPADVAQTPAPFPGLRPGRPVTINRLIRR